MARAQLFEWDGRGNFVGTEGLDTLLAGLPDVFVDLEAEARGEAVG